MFAFGIKKKRKKAVVSNGDDDYNNNDNNPKPISRLKKDISYEITPTNFIVLPQSEKAKMLASFIGVIGSAEKKMRLSIIYRAIRTNIAGKDDIYAEKSVYVTSRHDMGAALFSNGFHAIRLDAPVDFAVKDEKMNHLVMEDGTFQRTYAVYGFSKTIDAAWINLLSSLCPIVHVDIRKMGPGAAKRALISHANTYEERRGERYQLEAQQARTVTDMLVRQETSVYECGIQAVVQAATLKDLKAKCREFERSAKARQIKCIALAARQKAIMDGWGDKFLVPDNSLPMFYPFVSSELIEADGAGGVYLGTNELTGSIVVYDYLNRTNYNVIVLGVSGSGKSVAVKTYLDNFTRMMRERYPEQPMRSYIFDVHGEYASNADYFGMSVLPLRADQELGLDPFKLMADPRAAVDILADISEMKPNLRSLCASKAVGVKSTVELVTRLRTDNTKDSEDCRQAATYLAAYAEEGSSSAKAFRGDFDLGDNTVIEFRGASTSNSNDSMLISMTLQKIWNDIRKLPSHVPKLLVIEEAWFMLRMESTAGILLDIAKSGRKENVHMIVMTQDPDDLLNSSAGTTLVNNCDTIMALGLSKFSAQRLQKTISLSDMETNEIQRFDKGQMILHATRTRIKMRTRPTEKQLRVFDTSADGPGSHRGSDG